MPSNYWSWAPSRTRWLWKMFIAATTLTVYFKCTTCWSHRSSLHTVGITSLHIVLLPALTLIIGTETTLWRAESSYPWDFWLLSSDKMILMASTQSGSLLNSEGCHHSYSWHAVSTSLKLLLMESRLVYFNVHCVALIKFFTDLTFFNA